MQTLPDSRTRWVVTAMIDMSVLESKLGYQVRMTDRIMSREFLLNVGMTPVQYSVFSLIATNPDLSQVAVGAALHMDRASTMAIVDRLENLGLVERHRSPEDGRMHALRLTPKGIREFPRVDQRVKAHDDTFRNRLDMDALIALQHSLARIQTEF
jgi:MarR family transcriptional regulator, organic hydroperoxide resistance regulator